MMVVLIILFFPLVVCWSLWLVFALVAALPKRARGAERKRGRSKLMC